GAITGTPTTAGTFNFTVTATDGIGATGTKALSIVINPVVAVGPASLPAGTAGAAVNQTITASGGTGNKAVSYAVTGTLPAGLSISPSSPATNSFTISGTPTGSGSVTIAVTATDTVGAQATKSYTLTVNPGPATHLAVSF